MNLTHLHLMLTHVPVLGAAFGLALFAFALWRKSEELKKAALGTFLVAALLAVPVYLTGEPAEDAAKSFPGVTKMTIEEHEEAASVAFTSIVVLGVAALAGLLLFRRGKVPSWFSATILAAAFIVSGLLMWTANLGGKVRHTEIRAGISASAGAHKNHD